MERAAAPLVALFLIAAIGTGVYAYSLHGQLQLALAAQAAAEKKATQATQESQKSVARVVEGTNNLTACKTQLQEATNRADAAEQAAQTKSGGGKKR